ncbi:MAG: hypothetical protein K0Q55_104 [Verrucomicrobia bacterium]|nr:hypothetical protein [Verrucomicrobiota bacterium]
MNTLLFEKPEQVDEQALLSSQADEQPFRKDLYSVELLQRHARVLAQSHKPAPSKGPNLLLPRLAANEKFLREYNASTLRAEKTPSQFQP